MNFIDLAKNRFSCRAYESKEIEEKKLKLVIEAARIAPSANNQQPWFFYVVQNDKEMLQKMHDSYHREWFNDAPAVIVCCANTNDAWVRKSDNKNHSDVDISIAIDHITLAATDLGLATCWVCNFYVDKVQEYLNLPENMKPVALISLGYPKTKANTERFEKGRKQINEIAKFL